MGLCSLSVSYLALDGPSPGMGTCTPSSMIVPVRGLDFIPWARQSLEVREEARREGGLLGTRKRRSTWEIFKHTQ